MVTHAYKTIRGIFRERILELYKMHFISLQKKMHFINADVILKFKGFCKHTDLCEPQSNFFHEFKQADKITTF